VVQCGAVWCSVVQCGAVCCSVLQCVAVCCSVLQCIEVCYSVLQCLQRIEVCSSVLLQCVAVCCSVLQCVAMCCNGAVALAHRAYIDSVRFAGLFAGLKLAGLSPTKCHAREPRQKKLVPGALQKSKLGLPYSSQPRSSGVLCPGIS